MCALKKTTTKGNEEDMSKMPSMFGIGKTLMRTKKMPREQQGTGIGFGANGWFVAKEGGEGLRAEQRRVCYGFRTRVVGRRREVGS